MKAIYINVYVGNVDITNYMNRPQTILEITKELTRRNYSEAYIDAILLGRGYSVTEIKEANLLLSLDNVISKGKELINSLK